MTLPSDATYASLARRELAHGAGVRDLGVEALHHGRVFDVARARVELPSGLEQRYDVVLHAGAAAVAAVTDDGRLICVRQYRIPAGDWLIEVPAGRLEPGEDPLAAAQRELEEETGYRAAHWTLMRRFFPAVGFCTEVMYLYLATGLTEVGADKLAADDDEELDLVFATPAELLVAEPADAKTLVAALLVQAMGMADASETT
ncbi:MAG: NUDIX hydrolase [Planctomycetota bacterium]